MTPRPLASFSLATAQAQSHFASLCAQSSLSSTVLRADESSGTGNFAERGTSSERHEPGEQSKRNDGIDTLNLSGVRRRGGGCVVELRE